MKADYLMTDRHNLKKRWSSLTNDTTPPINELNPFTNTNHGGEKRIKRTTETAYY